MNPWDWAQVIIFVYLQSLLRLKKSYWGLNFLWSLLFVHDIEGHGQRSRFFLNHGHKIKTIYLYQSEVWRLKTLDSRPWSWWSMSKFSIRSECSILGQDNKFLCLTSDFFFQTEEGMRPTNKNNKIKPKNVLCHFKIKMMFGVISSLQIWHANYNAAQRDSDKSFLDENTSFTLTFEDFNKICFNSKISL